MATITPTVTYDPNGQVGVVLVEWLAATESDTCDAVELPAWTDGSVQIGGMFGSATVVISGSNDGTNYETLTDPQGNDISKTSADLEQITEVVRYIKPTFSGGSSQSINIHLLAVKG